MPGLFWLATVRAASIGIAPLVCSSERKLPELTLRAGLQDETAIDGGVAVNTRKAEKIVINVSGRRFEITRSELSTHPETLLGSEEIEYFHDELSNEYFFERDPDLFRVILAFYRTGKLHFNKLECVSAFHDELAFFGISPECVGSCCYEEYKEKSKELEEKVAEMKLPVGRVDRVLSVREKVWQAFENPQASLMGMVFYYVTGFFITVSVTVNIVETIGCGVVVEMDREVTCGERYETAFHVLDSTCVFIFTAEYLLRLFGAPCRWKFFKSAMSLIDIAAIMPFYLSLYIGQDSHFSGIFITLRVFRVFRIFKFSRHSAGLRILGRTLNACMSELGFLLFSLAMAIIIYGTILYYCEKSTPRSKFTSIPATFWYTIVTITTLGYGDMVPTSPIGKIVGAICSLSGVLVIALPVPVIVSNFSRIYHQSQRADKRKAQLNTRMRRRALSRIIASAEHSNRRDRYQRYWDGEDRFAALSAADNKDQIAVQHYHLLSCLERATERHLVNYRTQVSAEKGRRNTRRFSRIPSLAGTSIMRKASVPNGGARRTSTLAQSPNACSRLFKRQSQTSSDAPAAREGHSRLTKGALEFEENLCLKNTATPNTLRSTYTPMSSATGSGSASASGTGTATGMGMGLGTGYTTTLANELAPIDVSAEKTLLQTSQTSINFYSDEDIQHAKLT